MFYLLGDNTANNSGSLSFSETSGSDFIVVSTAGTYTLTIDLSSPTDYSYTLSEPSTEDPDTGEIPENLYIHDKSDDAAYYAELSIRTENVFECFYQATAWEGFYLTSTTTLSTGTIYGYAPNGSQYNVTSLAAEEFSTDDLWAFWFDTDADAYFYVQVDFEAATWTPQTINGFYVTGEFNSWSTSSNPMTYDSDTKTWADTLEIAVTDYGLQILADIEGASSIWDNTLKTDADAGNSSGELDWGSRNGTTNIPVAETGTYVITIDLSSANKYTYTLEKQ